VRLLLIRHAESSGNLAGVLQGRTDSPLTPRGERQAVLLAERLAVGTSFDALYASPLIRADSTARAIASLTGHAVEHLPMAMEYDFGEASGVTFQDAAERFSISPAGFPVFPGEEGRDQFQQRVCEAFWGLERLHPEDTVAVVTHGGPITVFCLTAIGLQYRRPAPFAIHNASITTLDIKDGRGTLVGLNDTCHLDVLGIE